MENYKHTIQFYETDKMGITHNSNYIRFMEEARGDFLDKIGCSYKSLEDAGFGSVVLSVDAEFKTPTTYADVVEIETTVLKLTPAKVFIGYTMTSSGKLVCTGKSSHCFLDKSGRPVPIKKISEEFFAKLQELSKESAQEN